MSGSYALERDPDVTRVRKILENEIHAQKDMLAVDTEAPLDQLRYIQGVIAGFKGALAMYNDLVRSGR